MISRSNVASHFIRKRHEHHHEHLRHHHHHHHHPVVPTRQHHKASPGDDSAESSSSEEEAPPCSFVRAITTSDRFVLLVSCVILVNVVIIGLQASFPNLYWPPTCSTEANFIERTLVKWIIRNKQPDSAERLLSSLEERHTLLIDGFPGRDLLNGQYRERLAPEFRIGNRSTFWDPASTHYIFFCERAQRWGIGAMEDWSANVQGECRWGAVMPQETSMPSNTARFDEIFTSAGNWDPDSWGGIKGGGVVGVATEEVTTSTSTGEWQHMQDVLGYQVDVDEVDVQTVIGDFARRAKCLNIWSVVNLTFLIFFCFEIAMRLISYRCEFFTGEDTLWNLFDLFIVVVGVGDKVMGLFVGHKRASAPLVTTLRVVRILRILRVLRVFKTFSKLSLLIRGLVESFTIISWICILMLMFMVSYAIFCTTLIGQEAESYKDPEAVRMYFGSVLNSTVTLFQFLTLDNWSGVTRLVWGGNPIFLPVILIYIVAISLVVVSLLSGVMAEHMNTVREAEEQRIEQQLQTKMKAAVDVLLTAFKRADMNDDKMINVQEFKKMLQEPDLVQGLARIEVELKDVDAEDMFNSFDRDHDGSLTWAEFRNGMTELRKPLGTTHALTLQVVQRVLFKKDDKDPEEEEEESQPPQQDGGPVELVSDKIEENIDLLENVTDLLADFDDELKTFVRELRDQHRRNVATAPRYVGRLPPPSDDEDEDDDE